MNVKTLRSHLFLQRFGVVLIVLPIPVYQIVHHAVQALASILLVGRTTYGIGPHIQTTQTVDLFQKLLDIVLRIVAFEILFWHAHLAYHTHLAGLARMEPSGVRVLSATPL